MSKSKFFSVLLFLVLLVPQFVWAAPPEPASQPAISDIRYSVNTDPTTGENKLRLVIEVTGPVQVSSYSGYWPGMSVTVDIKGAANGKFDGRIPLDGKIANDLTVASVDDTNSRIQINLPLLIADSGYSVYTVPADANANKPFRVVIDINKAAPQTAYSFTPGLKGKVIAIDPGHGGSDSGAIGPGQTQEKAVTLAVALKLKELLDKAGAIVYMTRMDDRDVYAPNDSARDELNARAMVGNQNNVDVFLDIHANAFQNPRVGGTGTYYYQKSLYDILLTQNLQRKVLNAGGLNDRGIVPANFYVLKHTKMPSALIELAFISNPDEENLLNSPPYQQKLAQGLADGLESFFTQAARLGGGASVSSN